MFLVDEATADAIRRAWNESGEFAAIAELQRHFPSISGHANALRCVHSIVSWVRLPEPDEESSGCQPIPRDEASKRISGTDVAQRPRVARLRALALDALIPWINHDRSPWVCGQAELAQGCAVGAELVSGDHLRREALLAEQLAREPDRTLDDGRREPMATVRGPLHGAFYPKAT